MRQPSATDALRRLDPLVGEWMLEASPPGGEPWPGGGRSTFEWHPSGAHLRQRTVVELPEGTNSLSIIGCDATNGTFFQLYSDERGVCRVHEMGIGAGEWRLWRVGAPFSQRFTVTLSDDGNSMLGRWEMSEDGIHYETDFDLAYRRGCHRHDDSADGVRPVRCTMAPSSIRALSISPARRAVRNVPSGMALRRVRYQDATRDSRSGRGGRRLRHLSGSNEQGSS